MGTRSVISYQDNYTNAFKEERLSLYQHYDGYPDGIAATLLSALDDIYEIEINYNGDEVAFWQNNTSGGMYASSIRGNRQLRPTTSPDDHGDLDFSYLVEHSRDHGWVVTTYERKSWEAEELEEVVAGQPIVDFINAGDWTKNAVTTFSINGSNIPVPVSKIEKLLNNARIQAGKYTPDNPNTKVAMQYVEALEEVQQSLQNSPNYK